MLARTRKPKIKAGKAGNRRRPDPEARRANRRGALLSGLRFFARLFVAILVVGGTFGSVCWVYVWATSSPRFAVTTVSIDGNARASLDELAPLTGIRPGTNIFLVDGSAAERRITGHPWVRSVAVRREPPNRVSIAIREYEPAVIVALGALYLADAEGTLFKQAMAGDGVDLPILSGVTAEEGDSQIRTDIQRGLDLLERWDVSGLAEHLEVSQVHLDPLGGASLTAAGREEDDLPLVIHLAASDVDERLARLSNLLALLSERGERPKEVFLDNRTRPQWVVARVDE